MLHRHLIFSFVLLVEQTGAIIADDLYLCIELVSMATTYLWQSYMDQPRKLAKPARGQLYPTDKYILVYICTGTVLLYLVCIPGTGIFFIWVHVHSCTVHCCICIYVYMCNYGGMFVELVYMHDHHYWARLPILLAVS